MKGERRRRRLGDKLFFHRNVFRNAKETEARYNKCERCSNIPYFQTASIGRRGQRPYAPERAGAWSATASPSLSSLSIQWLRQPGADAPLDGSGHRPMPPQLAALPLVVNSSFGVSSGAASRTSPFTIGERGRLGQPAQARHQPRKGVSQETARKDHPRWRFLS